MFSFKLRIIKCINKKIEKQKTLIICLDESLLILLNFSFIYLTYFIVGCLACVECEIVVGRRRGEVANKGR